MRPRCAAGEHRRLRRLDPDAPDVRHAGPERARHADEAARGADVADVGVEPVVELVGDLHPERRVPVEHVAVVELVGRVATLLGHDRLGAPHHRRDQVGVDALRARDQLDVGAERAHRPDLLGREGVGAHDPQAVPLHRAHERERAARAAAGVLDDGVAGRMSPRASAPSTIASAMRSLYEPVGLCDSSLTHTSAIPGLDQARHAHDRGVADGIEDGGTFLGDGEIRSWGPLR